MKSIETNQHDVNTEPSPTSGSIFGVDDSPEPCTASLPLGGRAGVLPAFGGSSRSIASSAGSCQREGQSPGVLGDRRQRDFLPEPEQTLFGTTPTPRMSATKSPLAPSGYGHGLSNGHNTPLNRSQAEKESQSRKKPHVITSMGGDFVQIKGRKLPQDDRERYISRRRAVSCFSHKSQQRLRRRVSEADKTQCGVPFFVTLTYPGIFTADRSDWMSHLDALDKRIRRRFPEFDFFVWKLEPQKRGAPHFHLLLCIQGEQSDESFLIILREFIARAWFEVVGSGKSEHLMAGTQVQQVKSWNGVKHYVGKYISKTFDGDEVPEWWGTGRFWGVRGEIPTHKVIVHLDLKQFYKLRRVANNFLRSVTRGSGFRPKIWAPDSGVAVHWSENTMIHVLAWLSTVVYNDPYVRPRPKYANHNEHPPQT